MIPFEAVRVQFRETICADGTVQQERLAFCHSLARWVPLARCKACGACAHLSGESEPVLICSKAPARSATRSGSLRARLARSVWCIQEKAPARLACLMPVSQADAIVIDDDGHAIGMLARERARRAVGDTFARELMNPAVVALFDGAPLETAVDLLSKKGVRTLPLLSAGRVIGCIDADEVLE